MKVLFEVASLSYKLMNAKASVKEDLIFLLYCSIVLISDSGDFSGFLLSLPNIQYLPNVRDVFSREATETFFCFSLVWNTFHLWETGCSSVPAHKQEFLEGVR